MKRFLQRPSNTDLSALFAGGREAKMGGEVSTEDGAGERRNEKTTAYIQMSRSFLR